MSIDPRFPAATLMREAAAIIESQAAELIALKASHDRLMREMERYLPVLASVEEHVRDWAWHTDSTGIATLNGYRAALAAAKEIAK